jgi:hypothetical protein
MSLGSTFKITSSHLFKRIQQKKHNDKQHEFRNKMYRTENLYFILLEI